MSFFRPPRNEDEIPKWREWISDVLLGKRPKGMTWDDVYPSAVSVGGGASAPAYTAYSGNFKAYEFLGTGPTTKDLMIQFQFPHARGDETVIIPHIHLYIPDDAAGGDITFGMEYHWDNIWDTGAISSTTVYGKVTRAANAGISKNHILSFGEIVGTGKGISSILSARIFRNPAATGDNADTFEASAWLRSADVHAQFTWFGSRESTSR